MPKGTNIIHFSIKSNIFEIIFYKISTNVQKQAPKEPLIQQLQVICGFHEITN